MESDLVAFLVARYFGLRKYGSIYGLIYVCYALSGSWWRRPSLAGPSTRPIPTGASSRTGAIILVVGAASFLTLGRYRFRVTED